MMRLDRYIIRCFLSSFLTVLGVFFILFFVINLVNELRQIGQGDYHFSSALCFVGLTLPQELERFFPIIFMMSGLLMFSRLSQHHELLAMTCFGISTRRVLSVCMGVVLVLSLMLMAGAEWWAPNLIRYAVLHKQTELNRGQAVSTPLGSWLHIDRAYIHIRRILSRDQLEGVTVYQFDEAQQLLDYAEYAPVWKLQQGKWQVFDAKRTVFLPTRLLSQSVPHYESKMNINSQLLSVGVIEPADLSLSELRIFSSYLEQNHINTVEYNYFFWLKLFQPWLAVCMVLFSMFFVLTLGKRTRLGFRMMLGVLFGFMFFLTTNFLGQVTVVYQWHPLFSALLIPTLCVAASFKLFRLIK